MRLSPQTGFSLIEVLISVFVLTVGVIGAAGMQLTALRTTQQSVFQNNALQLAAEMADRMRTNIGPMRMADPDNPYLGVDYRSSSSVSSEAGINCYGEDAYCDAQQLAQFDIADWLKRLDSSLPGGRVRICRDAMPWNATIQSFDWSCSSAPGNDAPFVIKIGWQQKNLDGLPEQDDGSSAPIIALTVAPYTQ